MRDGRTPIVSQHVKVLDISSVPPRFRGMSGRLHLIDHDAGVFEVKFSDGQKYGAKAVEIWHHFPTGSLVVYQGHDGNYHHGQVEASWSDRWDVHLRDAGGNISLIHSAYLQISMYRNEDERWRAAAARTWKRLLESKE